MWVGLLLWGGYLAIVAILVMDVVQSFLSPETETTPQSANGAKAAQVVCGKCKTRNRPTAKHCKRCGTKLKSSQSS